MTKATMVKNNCRHMILVRFANIIGADSAVAGWFVHFA